MRQPERQHRHQALAARERLGVAATGGEKLHGFGQRRRARVFEGRQFHDPNASFEPTDTRMEASDLSSDRRRGQRYRAQCIVARAFTSA